MLKSTEIRPDVIVTWPRHCDYPLWRLRLKEHRRHVGRVVVAFTYHHVDVDYRDFVAELLGPHVTCVDVTVTDGRDWRDAAVNAALDRSGAEWVWFTEQDLDVRQPGRFWWTMSQWADAYDAFAHEEAGGRWHPSCIIVRRGLVEETGRHFGPDPVDHFHSFGTDLDGLTNVAELSAVFSFGEFTDPSADVTHMAGLTQNHRLIHDARPDEVYKPSEMSAYLSACLASDEAVIHLRWRAEARGYLGHLTGGSP